MSDWYGPFKIKDIFDIKAGKRLTEADSVDGDTPFITPMNNNNGLARFVGNSNVSFDCNVLGVNYNGNGGMGLAFYHPYHCLFSDDVKRFHLKDITDARDLLLYLKVPIEAQRQKFIYNYKFNATRMENTKIILPLTVDGEPDWELMATVSIDLRNKLLGRYRSYLLDRLTDFEYVDITALSNKTWKRFRIFGDAGYLDIATTGSSIDGIRLINGNDDTVPYVTRSDKSNGISRFVSEDNYAYGYDTGGCITVGLDTQTAFWQPFKFVTGQNVQVITGDVLNKYVAMFLLPIFITQMKAKFNWGGNGATLGRMKRLEMLLPVDDSGEPDWEYMEQYAKNMMLRKYLQYLAYLESRGE